MTNQGPFYVIWIAQVTHHYPPFRGDPEGENEDGIKLPIQD